MKENYNHSAKIDTLSTVPPFSRRSKFFVFLSDYKWIAWLSLKIKLPKARSEFLCPIYTTYSVWVAEHFIFLRRKTTCSFPSSTSMDWFCKPLCSKAFARSVWGLGGKPSSNPLSLPLSQVPTWTKQCERILESG